MATKNFVPRADNEGGLGTTLKRWASAHIKALFAGQLVVRDGAGNYLQVPKLTTSERDGLTASNGMVIYNTTTAQLEAYQAGSWVQMIGGGSGGDVTSVFTRTGAVTAQSGDYTTAQVTESGNLYYTAARVLAVVLTGLSTATNAAITASDTVLSAFGKLQAQITAHLNNTSNPHNVTTITGNAGTATALQTARNINGVSFNGTANITVPDIIITASPGSDHSATGVKVALTAAVAMNFGDVGYIDSNGKVALGDADAIATSSCVVMCADASIAQDGSGNFIIQGVARDDTWAWTVGGLIYLSTTGTTGNTLTQTAPSGTDDVVQILGVATHADRMIFNPQLVQVEHT